MMQQCCSIISKFIARRSAHDVGLVRIVSTQRTMRYTERPSTLRGRGAAKAGNHIRETVTGIIAVRTRR